jgi:hypothetical protein
VPASGRSTASRTSSVTTPSIRRPRGPISCPARCTCARPISTCSTSPPGATRLAGSALFPNQAFRPGERVYGLQFHPEVTIEGFRRWQDAPRAAWGKPGAQDRAEQTALMHEHDAAQAAWFIDFLSRLFGRAR